MGDGNDNLNQSLYSSNVSSANQSDLMTEGVSIPARSYSLDDNPEDVESSSNSNVSYVEPPPIDIDFSYGPHESLVSDVSETSSEFQVCEPEYGTSVTAVPVQSTIENFNASSLSPGTLEGLFSALVGLGSSIQLSLELGMGVGVSVGIASAFGGIKIKLEGKLELDTEGKLKIEGGFSLGGYAHAEARFIFESSVERMGTIRAVGEFDSLTHFATYLHYQIVNSAQTIVSEMENVLGSRRYIPDSLLSISESRVSRQASRGPEVTSQSETRTAAEIGVGNEQGGASWGGARTDI